MDVAPTRPLNIFVISFGGPGDVHPMAALAAGLRQRGHRIVFISNPLFESLARQLDLEFAGFGSAQHLAHSMQSATRSSCGEGKRGPAPTRWLVQGVDRWRRRSRGLLGPMRWVYEKIERERTPGATVLVARGNAFGARIAQEKLGIPLATVHLQPAMLRSEYDAPGLPLADGKSIWLRLARRIMWAAIDRYADQLLMPETNAFRAELGLMPVRRLFSSWIHSPDLVLGLFPDWFAPHQPDWPAATHLVGFPLFDERGMRAVSPELEPFLAAGSPPVIFTAGSFHRNAARFFRVSAHVCRILRIRGLFLSPASDIIPGDLPGDVLHLPHVPLSLVLPRAAAIVHHGGIGTTGLALAAGIPQLVVPFNDDQSDNSARVERIGAGMMMSPAAYHDAAAADRLRSVLDSPEIASSCRSIAARMPPGEAIRAAIRLIENLGAHDSTG
jgi:rhamnosyltransferase subunit B